VAQGAHVINLSLGEQLAVLGTSAEIDGAIDRALDAGRVVVAAAGNSGLPVCEQPSGGGRLLCVGSVDQNRNRSFFSSFGDGLGLTAPGGSGLFASDILSTFNEGPDSYTQLAGTSQAAPHVAGVAALLVSKGLRGQAVVARLLATASDAGPPGPDSEYGAGIVNARRAVAGRRSGWRRSRRRASARPGQRRHDQAAPPRHDSPRPAARHSRPRPRFRTRPRSDGRAPSWTSARARRPPRARRTLAGRRRAPQPQWAAVTAGRAASRPPRDAARAGEGAGCQDAGTARRPASLSGRASASPASAAAFDQRAGGSLPMGASAPRNLRRVDKDPRPARWESGMRSFIRDPAGLRSPGR